jgi:trk system potassium uptake protein TrkH
VDTLALKNVAKILSLVGMFLSLFFGMPIMAGVLSQETIEPFVWFDLGLFVFNAVLFATVAKHPVQMRIKDAILTVNLLWLLLGISGAVPFVLSTDVSFVDGFFEAVSGYTTTGATIYSDIEGLPRHILLLRSLMHWLGGMGIIVLGVGLFSLINPAGSMALFKAEATGNKLEKLSSKIRDTAIRIWGVYGALTLVDAGLLWAEGMSGFDAINHAFSTLSTGGFSTRNASMGYWQDQPMILWTTTLFMMLAGINFLAHLRALKRDFSGYRSEEVRWYLIVFVVLGGVLAWYRIVVGDGAVWFSITHAFFSVASIVTTTGFGSVDYETWGSVAVIVIFAGMLMGGNAGSTAGGFKISRHVVLFKNIGLQVRRALHPKAITDLYVDSQRVGSDTLGIITGFTMLFLLTNVAVTFYLYMRGYDLMTSLSAAIAMVGNVGPGFARVGVTGNYAFFGSADKLILSAAMVLGRLEFYTVILLFSRTYWKRF